MWWTEPCKFIYQGVLKSNTVASWGLVLILRQTAATTALLLEQQQQEVANIRLLPTVAASQLVKIVICLIWIQAVISCACVYPGTKISKLLMFIQLVIKSGSSTIQPQVRSFVLRGLLSPSCSSSSRPPVNGKSLNRLIWTKLCCNFEESQIDFQETKLSESTLYKASILWHTF